MLNHYIENSHFLSLKLHDCCDIFSVNESWLKPCIPDSLVDLAGFSIVRCDRESETKSRGGGTALYVRSNIKFKILPHVSTAMSKVCDFSVWIEISAENSKSIIVGSLYVTPDTNKTQFLLQFSALLSSPSMINRPLVVVGDVNINWNVKSDERSLLQNTLDALGLSQHSTGVTYTS